MNIAPLKKKSQNKKPKCVDCKRRERLKHRKRCGTCANKRWRVDPIRASYNNLKSNAKRRKKVFTITLAYFTKFCYRTDYIAGKGRTADSYTVDRIIEELGYIPGNIQKLKNTDNVKKYLNYDWQHGVATVQTVIKETENLPF